MIAIAGDRYCGLLIKMGWSGWQLLLNPSAMVLQMDFVVTKENSEAFEKMYYVDLCTRHASAEGLYQFKTLRLFPDIEKEIEGEPTTYNYQIQICLPLNRTGDNWVASDQHKIAWPAATSLAKEYKWRGYDVMGEDDQRK